jgi:tRNA dimethylallyltransferase
MLSKTVIIITGPTASGKTQLAIDLALQLETSIISADSRQCFRELNIGVAKPDPAQLARVHHAFVNSHSVTEEVNAAVFESLALQYCEDVFSSRDVLVMCGGTGLYIKAFRDGLDAVPVIHPDIRKEIQDQYQEKGLAWLQESIRSADPAFYATGEITNPQRMMRAYEVIKSTGLSISSFRSQQKKQRPFRVLEFAIRLPRKELYRRINERTDKMMDAGLVDEVVSLIPYQQLNALQTVGYTEVFDFIAGECTLAESVERIKQHSRHYAKRQITWLNKNENLQWLEDDFLNRILAAYEGLRTSSLP